MSFIINDKSLLNSLINIGEKEHLRSHKKIAQDAIDRINSDSQDYGFGLLKSDFHNFFISSLNALSGDQLGNETGEQISIKIQDTPEELIKYLAENKISIGNEIIVTTSDKPSPVKGKEEVSFITGNCVVRKDLLERYLKILDKKYEKRPSGAKVAGLIQKTNEYISNQTNKRMSLSVDNEQNSAENVLDDLLLDSVPSVISEANIYSGGDVVIYVGDLSDEDSLIDWIEKNKQLIFVDDKNKTSQNLTWLKSPEKTQEIKFILLNFLSRRAIHLNQRQSGSEKRKKNKIYTEVVEKLFYKIFPDKKINNENQNVERGSAYKMPDQKKITDIINVFSSFKPFNDSDNGRYFMYSKVDALLKKMSPLIKDTEIDQYSSALAQHVSNYASEYGINSLDNSLSYDQLKLKLNSLRENNQQKYIEVLEKYLEILAAFLAALESYLGALKGTLENARSMYAYTNDPKYEQEIEKINNCTAEITKQIQYCGVFTANVVVWQRFVGYEKS